jgi:hypothetical protein
MNKKHTMIQEYAAGGGNPRKVCEDIDYFQLTIVNP